MRPLLCVTVTAPTMAELRRRRDAVTTADIVELRLDSVSDPSVAGALAGRRRPVIVTCRPTWEGGLFGGAEEERHRLLAEALTLGAEYIDVEWQARFEDLVAATRGRGIVLSMHRFDGVPADLDSRAQAMRATGAEVVKIAARVRKLSDCVPLYALGSRSRGAQGLIVIGIGEHGLATRVLAGRFGSKWAYAGAQADVGQLTPASLVDDYRFEALGDATDVYALVGRPVSHSVSPAMHNAAFTAAGIDAVYLPCPAADAEDFVDFARAIGIKGASVTTPYKVALSRHVDEASALARRIGAINTIRIDRGRWAGANTDVDGFLEPLRGRLALGGLRAAVLGAGGAARAVAVALASSGAHVRVHARDERRAKDVAGLVAGQTGAWPPEPGSWDLLVNCTPVGTYPRVDETPLECDGVTGNWVYDLVYNPTITRLMRDASAAGCGTIGGLEMLVAQAREQFLWWTGVEPPAGVMREAALRRLPELIHDEDHVI